ncbi:hypothetical protein [Sphingomonas crocodyli]|uniref:Uncharacterized protein n=1 Tax=Sphingomonas crocodyli TaxID=1979270 RepID=A0A437M9G8_9SPHN|nr:hypothetical protein [Sphingomonas crocodyli]RVT94360.1 hypothetical protein EOD43_11105 [Sphingomonas crocodyli]
MSISPEAFVELRQKILHLKDEVLDLTVEVLDVNEDAARSMQRARAALFEAWTLLVGPPEDDEDDH